MSITGEIVKRYLDKYDAVPSKTLARIIYSENKEAFTDAEHARSTIRTYRGRNGNIARKTIKSTKHYLPEPFKFDIPKSDAKEWLPYHIPVELKRGLIIADVHLPYHDEAALDVALQDARKFKCDFIVLNGDIIDCYKLSRFNPDPRARNFADELQICRDFLKSLRKGFPKAKIIYKEGNHERRYEDYLKTKAAELFGMSEFRLDVLLNLYDNKIDYVNEKRIIKYDKLNILHGDELPKGIAAPVNAARGAFLRTKDITFINHSHQVSSHTERTLSQSIISCWSGGCLCDLHPEYARINNWSHGYALIETSKGNDWRVLNQKIINGKIV